MEKKKLESKLNDESRKLRETSDKLTKNEADHKRE